MEKWLKDAREKVKEEAEMALWSCKRLAETESLEKDWVIEEFLKEFNKIKNRADGATKMRQITVGIHGKGGEAGIKAIQQLAGMVDSLKQCQTPQEVYDRYLQITGYCKCCVDCNFIDQKGADELMCLAAYLAGNEQARAEAQQKAGKKA